MEHKQSNVKREKQEESSSTILTSPNPETKHVLKQMLSSADRKHSLKTTPIIPTSALTATTTGLYPGAFGKETVILKPSEYLSNGYNTRGQKRKQEVSLTSGAGKTIVRTFPASVPFPIAASFPTVRTFPTLRTHDISRGRRGKVMGLQPLASAAPLAAPSTPGTDDVIIDQPLTCTTYAIQDLVPTAISFECQSESSDGLCGMDTKSTCAISKSDPSEIFSSRDLVPNDMLTYDFDSIGSATDWSMDVADSLEKEASLPLDTSMEDITVTSATNDDTPTSLLIQGDGCSDEFRDELIKVIPRLQVGSLNSLVEMTDNEVFQAVWVQLVMKPSSEELEAVCSVKYSSKKNENSHILVVTTECLKGELLLNGVSEVLTQPVTNEDIMQKCIQYGLALFESSALSKSPNTPESTNSFCSTDVQCESPRSDVGSVPSWCRQEHATKEKQRRERIKDSCDQLRKLLPYVRGRKTDMASILEMTVDYLKMVTDVLPHEVQTQLVDRMTNGNPLLNVTMEGAMTASKKIIGRKRRDVDQLLQRNQSLRLSKRKSDVKSPDVAKVSPVPVKGNTVHRDLIALGGSNVSVNPFGVKQEGAINLLGTDAQRLHINSGIAEETLSPPAHFMQPPAFKDSKNAKKDIALEERCTPSLTYHGGSLGHVMTEGDAASTRMYYHTGGMMVPSCDPYIHQAISRPLDRLSGTSPGDLGSGYGCYLDNAHFCYPSQQDAYNANYFLPTEYVNPNMVTPYNTTHTYTASGNRLRLDSSNMVLNCNRPGSTSGNLEQIGNLNSGTVVSNASNTGK